MSENVSRQAVQEASSDPAASPSPTITPYQQLATKLIAAVTALIAQVPRFEAAHPLTVGFVRSNQNVPASFIATVLAAVESNPELQNLNKFDVADARDTLQFLEAFKPLVDQVDALARDLRFTLNARKAKAAADGLQVYFIAKGISRDPGSAAMGSHVRNMKRDLRRSGPRKKKETPDTAPAPPDVVMAA